MQMTKQANQISITSITVYQSKIKLTKPFVISLGPLSHAENVIVEIKTNTGLIGFGECSPFMTIHGESMETCFVVARYLGQVLIGENPMDIQHCTARMDSVIFGNASIKSAFDMALYDIAAQQAKVPLYRLLGGSKQKVLYTDYTVSLSNPSTMASVAKEILLKGFPVIKVKLGAGAGRDVESIRQIRAAVGMDIPIRIDANQAWSIDEAIQILKALEPYRIQHCEAPIRKGQFAALAKIRTNSPIPIMADESCCTPFDTEQLIQYQSCDSLNIKLGKSAGLFAALKIIELAQAAGLPIQVGGFLESRLGFTAAAHLALSSTQVVYCDFDTPLMFEEDFVQGGMEYGPNGAIKIPEQIGLGAYYNADYLDQLPKQIID